MAAVVASFVNGCGFAGGCDILFIGGIVASFVGASSAVQWHSISWQVLVSLGALRHTVEWHGVQWDVVAW